ncbi:DmpA family aminopeptidase [Vibrio sagamiensis]|uniref:D-aminopeptidase n=1 Tax=Vibrio sagamiensis NBRC 104589 TaxID=1219064 RepID=A0A511QCK7_9VIBR|nr:P1 family peptidase [Vibrio sagamiensis]GEM75028.1 D-aminopeptidase [Vibrio sagamiensis NBRC 104589]
MLILKKRIIYTLLIITNTLNIALANEEQLRARDLGIAPGIMPVGKYNSITDVKGVRVGHFTLNKGESIRTGATTIFPHNGNIFREKVPAAMVIGNGFGKMMGYNQVSELGEIETPIILTNTLSIGNAANALTQWTLEQKGNEEVLSVNPVVGETNDGKLNDIRGQHLTVEMFKKALGNARGGAVIEGSIGAGMGTSAFGWKGGIGTSSRVLPKSLGGYTVGVLVQTNFGGVLQMDGIPVGKKLNKYYLRNHINNDDADGSCMIVIATDAPLSDRNLERVGERAMTGLGRTGSSMSNGSGDFAIAFSVSEKVRRTRDKRNQIESNFSEVPNNEMSPLFQATIEATEEAIYNSLLMATSVTSRSTITGELVTIPKLPIDEVKELVLSRESSKN